MKRTDMKSIFAWMLLLLATCQSLHAQTLTIGNTIGTPGAAVSLPLTLGALTPHTAVLVRIEYDAAVLDTPTVSAGALLSPSHLLASSTPAAGRFDVASIAGKPLYDGPLVGT